MRPVISRLSSALRTWARLPPAARASANSLCPALLERSTQVVGEDKVVNFKELFQVPLAASVLAAIALAVLFHPPKKSATAAGGSVAPH